MSDELPTEAQIIEQMDRVLRFDTETQRSVRRHILSMFASIRTALVEAEARAAHKSELAAENLRKLERVDERFGSSAFIEDACRVMHSAYEEAARRYGWQSQSPVPWEDVPDANQWTMRAAVDALLQWIRSPSPSPTEDEPQLCEHETHSNSLSGRLGFLPVDGGFWEPCPVSVVSPEQQTDEQKRQITRTLLNLPWTEQMSVLRGLGCDLNPDPAFQDHATRNLALATLREQGRLGELAAQLGLSVSPETEQQRRCIHGEPEPHLTEWDDGDLDVGEQCPGPVSPEQQEGQSR